ncbi:MAG: autotransporter domain-containing protein [Lysobacter sp.]|nr:MAG: autotransporter domain-containing protein [Lysobacter sp.]
MKPVRTALAAALALAALPAFAQTYSQTIFFGDSLTDSGTFRPALISVGGPAAASLGRFTTNPALVYAEYIADFYGTRATPSNQGGTNYAVGGARVTTNTAGAFGPIPSLQAQVNTYLSANGGRADSNALYTVFGGANDLFAIAGGAPAGPTLGAAVAGQIGIVNSLTAAGARYILVPTLPDLGLTPAARAQGPAAQAQFTALSTNYNNALFSGLASAKLRVIPLDTFTLLREIVASPAQFGITNISGTACNPQITAQSLTCNPSTYANPSAPYTYLFADGVHPTLVTHRIFGDYAISMLEAPRQVAVLPHTAAVVGRARADRVDAQFDARSTSEGEGMRWWADVRGDFQRYDHGGLYDGAGPSLTAGVDWRSGSLIYGGFGGFGRSNFDFGRRGGSFDQREATLGGYAGWRSGPAWVNGQLSYGRLNYNVDRDVQLGIATRRHHGEAGGRNLTAGIQGGWEFGSGALRHGPVAGVLLQQIRIDGFAEDQPALSTSLAYPSQTFDSRIGKLGWQMHYEGGAVAPYARITFDREFGNAASQAFARSQTLGTTGNYAVPGLAFDDSYATIQFGARASLFGLKGDVGASLTNAQKRGNDATVYMTVGSDF